MDVSTGLLLLFIGIIAGGYGTIVGAGGGFIFVPALLLIFRLEPVMATGTGLVIVLINSISSVIGYAKQKKINYRTGLTLGLGALPGSLLGVWLLQIYSSSYFLVILATFLVALGIFLFVSNSSLAVGKRNQTPALSRGESRNAESLAVEVSNRITTKINTGRRKTWLVLVGFVIGVLSSYLGIGGGWLVVPILIYFFKESTHFATATSIFSITLYSIVGVIFQMYYSSINWSYVIWGGIGVIIGSQIGVLFSQRIPNKVIIQMLSVLLMIIGFRLYFN